MALAAENDSAMMISCDQCNVWQHGPCVGIYSDDEAPDGESRGRRGREF